MFDSVGCTNGRPAKPTVDSAIARRPSARCRPDAAAFEQGLIVAMRALSSELTCSGACEAALHAVERVFGATSAWIMLLDAHARTLRTAIFRGAGSDVYHDASIPLDGGVVSARVCRQREVVFVPDVRREHRWYDPARVHSSGLRSVFMAPLVFRDRVLGLLALDAPCFTEETPPDEVDTERVLAVATQIAVALTNARLFEASEQDRGRLRVLLKRQKQLSGIVTHLQREVDQAATSGAIVGEATCFLEVLHQVELVARADTTVLVVGETGSGKDVLARLLHQRSRRASGPFIAVNCAALPEHLVESELFGHERGAFTGAVAQKAGCFEIAQRGTIFLDEIGDLPLDAQAKLLRVLQEREVRRVGGTRPIPVDVRVVAATNQHLERAIAERRFRPDLFYRLGVFPIRVPSLRERREDIPLLADHIVSRFARKMGRPIPGIAPEARAKLVGYDWPGNVRELQNVLERAVILADGDRIGVDALHLVPTAVAEGPTLPLPAEAAAAPAAASDSTVVPLADAERRAILNALNAAAWRISGRDGAASRLGTKPTTLHAKMKRLGIRRPAPFVQPSI